MEEAYKIFIRTQFGFDLQKYNSSVIHMMKLYIINLRKQQNLLSQKIFLLKCRQQQVIPKFITNKTNRLFKDFHNNTKRFIPKIITLENKLNSQYLNL